MRTLSPMQAQRLSAQERQARRQAAQRRSSMESREQKREEQRRRKREREEEELQLRIRKCFEEKGLEEDWIRKTDYCKFDNDFHTMI